MHKHKVIYDPDITKFGRSMSIKSTYQELLLWKAPSEEIIVIFDLSGQRGYMVISSMEDYNWYLNHTRGDGRFSEDFFWIVNKKYLV